MDMLHLLYISGMAIPVIYILMCLLGGALRSDYSHIRHPVSGLLAPGAPNRPLLMTVQIIYAALHITFGPGVLWFVLGSAGGQIPGQTHKGLVERFAALITQQWLFVLGLILFLQ